jgi:hypothetical protein
MLPTLSPNDPRMHRGLPLRSLRGLALCLPICSVWGPGLTGYGGLAPAAVVVLTALTVAAITALTQEYPETNPNILRTELKHSVAEIIGAGVVGACFAPLIHDFGTLPAMVIAGGLWLMAIALNRLGSGALLGLLAAFALMTVAFSGNVVVNGLGWTLLEPQWATWRHWMGASVMGGLMIGGMSAGSQSLFGEQTSAAGEGSHWISLGCCLLAFSGGLLLIAYEWEQSAPKPSFNMLPLLGWLAVLAAASAFQMGPRSRWAPWTGILFCAWFAGPGFPAVNFWWVTLLPALTFAYLVLSGLKGWRVLLAGTLFLSVMAGAWPGLPPQAESAGVLGMTIVFVFWLVASRGALARDI